ncbi:MAG: 4Fe-4S binding protein [Candidatus Jordarchaeales archaeon]|nr:4Fe-4S binding protein [Candidatus Jordarchaeia archaeon]
MKRLSVVDPERCVGCQMCMFACTRRFSLGGFGRSTIHVKSVGGMERGFVVVVCRACDEPAPCARVCPTDALVSRDGKGVRLVKDRCIGCGKCVEACPIGAVFWDEEAGKPAICVYCGYCADYCEYGVIKLEEV